MLGDKKVSYSAMQSTGTLTLGNYLGALDNWLKMQEEYECFYAIADLHSLTIRQNPAELRKRARDLYALYVAAGLDPEKNCIYFQSHVSAHAELAWILDCFTYMGELNRMTQFKDKAAKHADNINAGLFTYPSLPEASAVLFLFPSASGLPVPGSLFLTFSASAWHVQDLWSCLPLPDNLPYNSEVHVPGPDLLRS